MARTSQIRAIALLLLCAGLAGCGRVLIGGSSSGSGNSSVVLAMTDLPPTNVSILAAKVTLTGATLNPGNVSVFSGPTTVELTKLQTDVAYLATASNVPAATYTSLTLTFANPMLTIENDTNNSIGPPPCTTSLICTIEPTPVNMSTTISLSGFTTIAGASAGLLVDVNLDNLLSVSGGTMTADFKAGTGVTLFTPAGGAPLVGAEDVVGQVVSVTSSSNTFVLQNVTGSFPLKVDGATTFFPSSVCATPSFSCLQTNQILSADIGIQADGSLHARNIVFEDGDSSDAEVEGIITSTNAGSQEFNIVVLAISATGTGLSIGDAKTVQFSTSAPSPTIFDLDVIHADNVQMNTTLKFAGPTDFAQAGQQVSIRRNSSSTADLIKADRVRLRSSRITSTVSSIGSPFISLFNLPSLFFGHGGVTAMQVQTTSAILLENNKSIFLTNIPPFGIVSVRGPLFNTGTSTQNLVASKVVLKP